MVWFWLCLGIALLAIEVSTTQLMSIWFAIGACIVSMLKAIFPSLGIAWQVLIFVVLSVALLVATRPLVKRLLSRRGEQHATNLELTIGKEALVVEEINNILGKGAVKINGLIWSARSADDSEIPVDTIVIFKEISGNKAIVEKKGE
ncbi:MAG: NfeD family protein [Clostridia bacterium]|nr:NfeD family protein [Clostridia bacterium]